MGAGTILSDGDIGRVKQYTAFERGLAVLWLY